MAGSCGTAAYTGQRVIAENIETDPLWADYKGLALRHNLKACWSQPILSHNGQVLGTFAIYYRVSRAPSDMEVSLLEVASELAAVAIEWRKTRQDFKMAEDEYQALFSHSLDAILITDDDGRYLNANPAACQAFGLARTDIVGRTVEDLFFPGRPEEFQAVWHAFLQQQVMVGDIPFTDPQGNIKVFEFKAISNYVPGRHLSSLRDVTVARQAQQDMQQPRVAKFGR